MENAIRTYWYSIKLLIMNAIHVTNLTKVFQVPQKEPGMGGAVKALFVPKYVPKVAVDQVSFDVQTGEMVGYIGLNGAGKSTTIKMLSGILVPTSGEVQVLGRDPYRERVANAREIGVVFGQRTQMWWDLAFIESLNLIARIYDIQPARYKELLDRFAKELEINELLNIPIRNMSLGQRMRAELVATLIHEPRVTYLDEPTIGLDLIVKERIREFIKEENHNSGNTIILTTHDLGDIEELCSRVIIIDKGKLIYDGSINKIKARFGKVREVIFEVPHPPEILDLPAGAEILSQEVNRLTLRFDKSVITASQVVSTIMNQIEVNDFSLSEPNLATVIKHIYNGELNGQED
ncbi:MAG: ABC transporter ATP-binding protein [Bellilinea sp.]